MLNTWFLVITGRGGDTNLGAGAVLFDPVPAERGRLLNQRIKPRTASTGRRICRGEDTVWRHPLRRPIAGEGWGPGGGLHCCCGNQLSHGVRKRLTQKQEINTPIINQAIIPTPYPSQLFTHFWVGGTAGRLFQMEMWDVMNTNSMPRISPWDTVRNVEYYVCDKEQISRETWNQWLLKQAVLVKTINK